MRLPISTEDLLHSDHNYKPELSHPLNLYTQQYEALPKARAYRPQRGREHVTAIVLILSTKSLLKILPDCMSVSVYVFTIT